jgi:hypothetical protein
MSIINLGSIPQALQQTVAGWHGMWYKENPSLVEKLFETRKSSKYYEEIGAATGLGLAREKADGGSIQYDDMRQFYTTRFYQLNYSVAFQVTENMFDFNQYAEFAWQSTKDRARALNATTSNNCANIFNFAFTSGYTGGDGQLLCSTSHPLGAGNTAANRPTNGSDLNEAYLEDAGIAVSDYTNEAGIPAEIQMKALVTSTNDRFNAARLLKSEFRPDSANNDINAINETNALPMGSYTWVYLSDSDATFIVTNVDNGLLRFETKAPEYDSTVDFDSSNMKFKATMREAVGWADWRAVYGSPGA